MHWVEETFPGGGGVTVGPMGVVMYGAISWRRMQDLELSKMTTERPGFPEFDGEHPPTEAALAEAWNNPPNVRKREDIRRMVEDPEYRQRYRPTFEARAEGEPVGLFYSRVSEFYRRWAAVSKHPTQDLAEAASVPKTTAARWVREARIRGFLPPTSKGKVTS